MKTKVTLSVDSEILKALKQSLGQEENLSKLFTSLASKRLSGQLSNKVAIAEAYNHGYSKGFNEGVEKGIEQTIEQAKKMATNKDINKSKVLKQLQENIARLTDILEKQPNSEIAHYNADEVLVASIDLFGIYTETIELTEDLTKTYNTIPKWF